MTEEEAKKRICPHIRYCCNPDAVAQDARPAVYEHSPCLGSECMAWRWDKKPNPAWTPETMVAMYPPRNPYSRENEPFVYDDEHRRCGLAGQR